MCRQNKRIIFSIKIQGNNLSKSTFNYLEGKFLNIKINYNYNFAVRENKYKKYNKQSTEKYTIWGMITSRFPLKIF